MFTACEMQNDKTNFSNKKAFTLEMSWVEHRLHAAVKLCQYIKFMQKSATSVRCVIELYFHLLGPIVNPNHTKYLPKIQPKMAHFCVVFLLTLYALPSPHPPSFPTLASHMC